MTEDLAAWLLEQIAEDERLARTYLDSEQPTWASIRETLPVLEQVFRDQFSPVRVLAECDAKRRIIAECSFMLEYARGAGALNLRLARQVLRFMAVVYADRPGYREEWRVDTPGT